jgi:nucleotidyltransferase/DNA polymerase involved in DNA repair
VPAGVAARAHQVEDAQVLRSSRGRRSAAARSGLFIPADHRIEQKMNSSTADNVVQWLFLDLNAFFPSCKQQENPALRGRPVIVVQTPADSAVAIAASYAAKAFGIKTGTLMREARQLCPAVIPVQAHHRLYTEYHERILKAVDTCLPVEKVCSIDEMACKLMGTERQGPVARELALKVKRALREQVGECLTCSIGIAPNVFLGKVGSDLQKPDGLVVITHDKLPDILLRLDLQEIYGIGPRMEQRLQRAGIMTVTQLWNATPFQLRRVWGGINGLLFHQMLARRRHPAALLPVFEKHRASACAGAAIAYRQGRARFRAASADQGGRTAAPRRLLLPPVRRASVLDRRSRRLVG